MVDVTPKPCCYCLTVTEFLLSLSVTPVVGGGGDVEAVRLVR
jgi:hypothetical protein